MPCELHYVLPGLRIRFSGTVTGRDLQQNIEQVCSHPDFASMRYCVLDLRDVSDLLVSKTDVEAAAAFLIGAAYTNPDVYLAIIASRPTTTELVRHFLSIRLLPIAPQLFADEDAARIWIRQGSRLTVS